MQILAEKENGTKGKWLLVKYSENFFAYGSLSQLNSIYGVPVQQYGTKKEVLDHCNSIIALRNKHILQHQKEFKKDKQEGWLVLINDAKKDIETLEKFVSILSNI